MTLTALVSPGSATGKVTFYDTGSVLGTASLQGETATFAALLQATGQRTFSAHYTGNGQVSGGTSAPLSHPVRSMPNHGYKTASLGLGFPTDVRTGDFNGDGKLDVVATTSTGLVVLLGNGDGTFGASIPTASGRLYQILVGDFDGDGKLDLAAVVQSPAGSGGLAIFFGHGDGTFSAPRNYGSSITSLVTVADVNDDGFPDVVTSSSPSTTLQVFLNRRDGTMAAPSIYQLPVPRIYTGVAAVTTAMGDLDGDGSVDLVAVTAQAVDNPSGVASNVTILLGNGDGTFRQSATSFVFSGSPGYLAIGDLNGDGKPDLAMGNGPITIFIGDGIGGFGGATTYQPLNPATIAVYSAYSRSIVMGDFDGDGNTDVAELFTSEAASLLEIFSGNRDGTVRGPSAYPFPAPPITVAGLLADDFNGDGRLDFVSGNTLLLGSEAPLLTASFYGPANLPSNTFWPKYTVLVGNGGGLPTSGSVTVEVGAPGFVDLSGTGWSCTGSLCTRTDSLPTGGLYPPLTVVLTLMASAGQTTAVGAVISGGGSAAGVFQERVSILPAVTSCTYSIAASRTNFDSGGSNGESISIVSPLGCEWEFDTYSDWVTIANNRYSNLNGGGNGAVFFNVAENSYNFPRSTDLHVAGQTIHLTQAAGPLKLAPVVSWATNAFTNLPPIAPNTWVVLKGSNLSRPRDARTWQLSDFVNSQMPTELDGVSVTVNGKKAFVYYISSGQVNILTPPDALPDSIAVQVTVDGARSNAFQVAAQRLSPSFYEAVSSLGLPYVLAQHADYSLVGPPFLFPGLSTPAKPGETLLLYATGFGPTDVPVVSGSSNQAGTAQGAPPAVTVGGLPAAASNAVLIWPGEYQINVVVPANAPDGDLLLSATFGDVSTQANLLLSVQH